MFNSFSKGKKQGKALEEKGKYCGTNIAEPAILFRNRKS